MAHSAGEVEQMTALAGALVLNIGTLQEDWIENMILAARQANRCGVPVVLDPVGAGATPYRTNSVKRILQECRIDVIRGNASEIMALRGSGSTTKGVDSLHAVSAVKPLGSELARETGAVVAISGAEDFITDGERALSCLNGTPLLTKVTGTGCASTALIGAFLAVEPDCLEATALGIGFLNVCAEIALQRSSAPGSFAVALLDALFSITPREFSELLRITEERP
jgi:hydroxyethylthiazole kinase